MEFNFNKIFASRKVQLVLVVAALALAAVFLRDANPTTLDLNLGIEFVGGVRIPVSLERSVDSLTMDSMVEIIKERINRNGLSQAIVRPLGDKEIIVEIPRAEASVIKSVERLLREQGRFEAVIDGRQALNGTDILSSSVGGGTNERVFASNGGYSYELGFAATRPGAEKFAATAKGKAHYPVYMFLDRPSNALLVLEESLLNTSTELLNDKALREALAKQGDDIEIVFVDAGTDIKHALANKSMVVMDEGLKTRLPSTYQQAIAAGFSQENASKRLALKPALEMLPSTYKSERGETIVNSWRAIGLLSGPTLSPGLAEGFVSQFYQVTGSGRGSAPEEQRESAVAEIKLLKIVISGGKLPVSTVVGSSYSIAPSLGRQFLKYSALGIVLSVAIVALLIIFRYRKPLLALPIVLINAIEMLVTLAIIGTFGTLDLAGMAGVITLIGTGVDDQIIITDEMLRKKRGQEGAQAAVLDVRERLGRAFEVVMTNASVAIVAMLPLLLLSGLVEIRGFALAYIIGVLVGVLITRPAFGVIVGELFGDKAETQ